MKNLIKVLVHSGINQAEAVAGLEEVLRPFISGLTVLFLYQYRTEFSALAFELSRRLGSAPVSSYEKLTEKVIEDRCRELFEAIQQFAKNKAAILFLIVEPGLAGAFAEYLFRAVFSGDPLPDQPLLLSAGDTVLIDMENKSLTVIELPNAIPA